MRLTIGKKIGITMILMVLLLLSSGLSGLYGLGALTENIDFLTNNVRNTSDGSKNSTIDLKDELIFMQQILTSSINSAEGKQKIAKAEAKVKMALAQMTKPNLISQEKVNQLNDRLSNFRQYRIKVIESFNKMQTLETQVSENFSKLDEVMGRLEEQIEEDIDEIGITRMKPITLQKFWDVNDTVMQVRINLLRSTLALSRLMAGDNKQNQLKIYESSIEIIEDEIEYINSPSAKKIKYGEKTAVDHFNQLYQQQKELNNKIISAYNEFTQGKITLNKVMGELLKSVDDIGHIADTIINEKINDIEKTKSVASITLILTIAIGLFIATIVTFLSFKMIVNPIRHVAATLTKIADHGGDLTQKIDIHGNDEITDLAKGFNVFIEETHSIITQVKNAVKDMIDESVELSKVINENREGADAQLIETKQVTNAVTEMINMVEDVTQHAQNAEVVSNDAESSAKSGGKLVSTTTSLMHDLSSEMEQASTAIAELSTNTNAIGGVVGVINGIAEQTNLLALNAAIEAARAGEQGRGFAVVADEVRNLASKTQDSIAEIQSMTDALESAAKQTITFIKNSHNQANSTAESANKANAAINDVVSSVNSIHQINGQIAIATKEQERTSEIIGKNTASITTIAEITAKHAIEAEESSMKLMKRSGEMLKMISKFKM